VVDDLDRRGQLVGIDPDHSLLHALLPPALVRTGTARWALLLRAGQSPLEPRLVTVLGAQTESEPHPSTDGQPKMRATRRAPGPSLARHRSCVNALVAHNEGVAPRTTSCKSGWLRGRVCQHQVIAVPGEEGVGSGVRLVMASGPEWHVIQRQCSPEHRVSIRATRPGGASRFACRCVSAR
jgi:hypothetical protein